MGKKLRINYLLNTTYQVLVILVPVITTPYISRVLGASGVGVYSYTYSIVSYFILISSLGSSTYGRREIAYCQDNRELRSIKFWTVFSLKTVTGSISIFMYLLYVFLYAGAYKDIAFIQSLYLFSDLFDIIWLFQGMEDFKRVVIRNATLKLINICFIFSFVKNENDVWLYTIILSGMNLVANLSMWLSAPKYISFIPLKKLRPFSIFKEEFSLFLPTIAVQMYTYLDKSMIGLFSVGTVENGYYEQTEKIVRMALAVVTSLGTVMTPRIAKLFSEGRMDAIQENIRKSFRFTCMLALPVMFGIIAVSQIFVPVFFGKGFEKILVLLPLYALVIPFVSLSNLLGIQFLIPIGKQNAYTAAVSLSAILNVFVNFILIPRYYSVGACVATIIAEAIGSLYMVGYCRKKRLLQLKYIFADSRNYIVASALMCCIILVASHIAKETVSSLIILIVIGMGIYFASLTVLKDRIIMDVISLCQNKMKGATDHDRK